MMKRDSKDPMPTASNSARAGKDGGGNTPYPSGAEKHSQSKAMKVSADSRFGSGIGPKQPTRMNGDGNTMVSGEMHDSAKGEKISADSRW